MKTLTGVIDPMPTDPPVPANAAQRDRIVEAAQAYVTALKVWNARTKWDDHKRRALHLTQWELAAAVEAGRS